MGKPIHQTNVWLLPLLALVLGLVCSEHLTAELLSPWIWGTGFLLAGLGLWRWGRSQKLAPFILVLAFFSLGLFRQSIGGPTVTQAWHREEVTLRFQVLGRCEYRDGRSRFPLRLLAWQAEGGWHHAGRALSGFLYGKSCPVKAGGLYQGRAKLRTPRSPGNPTARNWQRYFQRKGVHGTARLRGPEWIVPLEEPAWGLWKLPDWWRGAMIRHDLSLEVIGLWGAMLWRDSTYLSPALRDLFQKTGLSHLLVVSGLHFALLFSWSYFFLFVLGLFFPQAMVRGWWRFGSLALAWLISGLYAWTLGYAPSVARAFFAISLWVLCRWFSLGRASYWLLAMIATLLVLLQPGIIWETGAQLSFFAVALLLSFQDWCEERSDSSGRNQLDWRSQVGRYFFRQLARCILLALALFPLTRSWFPYFSWVSPVANVMAIPFVAFGLLPGLYLSLPMELLGLGEGWAHLLEAVTHFFIDGLRLLEQIPGALQLVTPWRPWAWAFYGFFLSIYFLGPRRWRCPRFRRQVVYGFILLSVSAWPDPPAAFAFKLTMIDVGQGESILLESPQGRTMLIDGGGVPWGDFDVGEKILLPELLARSIRKLDVMVLTHPDADHLLGLIHLAEHLPVGEFWEAKGGLASERLVALRRLLQSRGAKLRQLYGGQVWEWDGVQIEILSPPQAVPSHWSANDRSLVLRICYSEVCGMLMGDLEEDGEQVLLSRETHLQSQWLKLGHHGSKSSTTKVFLDRVNPRLALASMGYQNRFGFPHREIKDALAQREILFLRTDRDGQIELKIEAGELFWRRFRDVSPIPNR